MQPVRTQYANRVLGAPKGWGAAKHGPCIGLPVCTTDDPYVYSWWRPSWRERLSMLFGRPVRLCIVGGSMPPVSVDVDATAECLAAEQAAKNQAKEQS